MLRRGKGAGEIAVYLGKVRTQALRRDENEEADEAFADRVVAWYSLEKPTRPARRRTAAALRRRSTQPRPRPRSA